MSLDVDVDEQEDEETDLRAEADRLRQRLADLLGSPGRLALMWAIVWITFLMIGDGSGPDAFTGAAALVFLGGIAINYLAEQHVGEVVDDVEDLQMRYADGDLDLEQFEREVEVALDPRNEEIRQAVEQVDGVGPVTASAIALRFRDLDTLRDASLDAIESVSGVGPTTSAAIVERLSDREVSVDEEGDVEVEPPSAEQERETAVDGGRVVTTVADLREAAEREEQAGNESAADYLRAEADRAVEEVDSG